MIKLNRGVANARGTYPANSLEVSNRELADLLFYWFGFDHTSKLLLIQHNQSR